jgi:4-hydroxy-tetrahydrodipicolinate reductase
MYAPCNDNAPQERSKQSMKKIFVAGASGNVGRTILKGLKERQDMELVGGFCAEEGQDLGVLAGGEPQGVTAYTDLAKGLDECAPDMVIDFTSASILMDNIRTYADLGLDAVIGTTGLSQDDAFEVEHMVEEGLLRFAVIPNFGLGITLLMDFLEKARAFYPYVSITDRHPVSMANAPSGTAAMLAENLPEGPRGEVRSKEVYPGVLGGTIASYPVHSQRFPYPGPFSEHEIMLGRQDEVIRITISDFTSAVYLDGIFMAVNTLAESPGGTLIRTLGEML